jgi:hypothetical protein
MIHTELECELQQLRGGVTSQVRSHITSRAMNEHFAIVEVASFTTSLLLESIVESLLIIHKVAPHSIMSNK